MNHAAILYGVSIGVSLLTASFAVTVAIRSGWGATAKRTSSGVRLLFGCGLLITVLIPLAAFSGEIILLKAVLLLAGVFALVGVALGTRASGALKRRSS